MCAFLYMFSRVDRVLHDELFLRKEPYQMSVNWVPKHGRQEAVGSFVLSCHARRRRLELRNVRQMGYQISEDPPLCYQPVKRRRLETAVRRCPFVSIFVFSRLQFGVHTSHHAPELEQLPRLRE
jgi:hypothetical protein